MPITLDQIGWFWLWLLVAGLAIFPAWLLMRFITPKQLTDRYFREPHFTLTELIFFAQYPGSMVRTMVFVWACIKPQWTKKRKLDDILQYAPRWYVVTAKIFVVLVFGYGFVLALLTTGLGIYTYLTE